MRFSVHLSAAIVFVTALLFLSSEVSAGERTRKATEKAVELVGERVVALYSYEYGIIATESSSMMQIPELQEVAVLPDGAFHSTSGMIDVRDDGTVFLMRKVKILTGGRDPETRKPRFQMGYKPIHQLSSDELIVGTENTEKEISELHGKEVQIKGFLQGDLRAAPRKLLVAEVQVLNSDEAIQLKSKKYGLAVALLSQAASLEPHDGILIGRVEAVRTRDVTNPEETIIYAVDIVGEGARLRASLPQNAILNR